MLLMDEMITLEDMCTSFSSIWTIVGYVIFAIKVVVPIILIVTGMIALTRAIIGAKEDDITKCKGILAKKVIYALAVFLTIQLVGIIIGMVSENSVYKTCAQCAFKPFSSGCYVIKDDSEEGSGYVDNPTTSPTVFDEEEADNPTENKEEVNEETKETKEENKNDDKNNKEETKKNNETNVSVIPPVQSIVDDPDDDVDEGKEDKEEETITPVLEKIVPTKSNVTIVVDGKTKKLTYSLVPSTIADADITYSSSNTKVVTVSSDGTLTAKKEGTATITLTSGSVKATVNISVKKKEEEVVNNANPVDIYFLNTQTVVDKLGNEAIIMKTRDNKYVLLDTGNNKVAIKNMIYNKLKALQDSDKVVIDYMIISHLHVDHSGSAAGIINNPNITVKNLIYKDENFNHGNAENFLSAASSNNVKVYNQFKEEGSSVKVGDYLTLSFYNVKDVFSGFSDCGSGYLGVGFTNNPSDAALINVNGTMKYIYIDGNEYNNGTYRYHVTDNATSNGKSGFNQRFYAYIRKDVKNCYSNGNSYGIVASVNTDNGARYAYFANDLENVGYSVMPEGKKKVSGPMMFSRAYGNPGSKPSELYFDEKTNDFAPLSSANHKVASETNVANKIVKDIDPTKILIYQTSHHGYNDSPDAINILNLNKKGVYAITNTALNLKEYGSFLVMRSYYATLGNTTRLTTASSTNGVECNIKKDGFATCANK